MPKPKFPKTLYVTRNKDGDIIYFDAHDDARNAAEIGAEIEVGVYELARVRTITTEVLIKG